MLVPVTTITFPQILRSQGIPWNRSNPTSEETDLGDKFEVVGRHCAGILNQGSNRFPGFVPDGVLDAAQNCNPLANFIGLCTRIPNMTFVEIKYKFGPLGGRDFEQGTAMVNWLATAHVADIANGHFPSLIYVTVAETVIPPSLITLATGRMVRMAQYIVASDDAGGTVTFSSMPVLPLNNIPVPRGTRMVAHMFSPTLRPVPIGVMQMSLIGTRGAP